MYLIYYISAVFVPAHFFPILFWIGLYFYYGAMVNSSYDEVSMYLNNVGNIIDSVKTQLFEEQQEREVGGGDYKEKEGKALDDAKEKCLAMIADEAEYVCHSYLYDVYGDNIQAKIDVISYCKELLQDETDQLSIDATQNMIYFMNLYPITLETIDMIQGYLMSGISLILTYVGYKYMNASKKKGCKSNQTKLKNGTCVAKKVPVKIT